MTLRRMHRHALTVCAVFSAWTLSAQPAPKITTPKDALGFNIGDDYQMASYSQLDTYWHTLAKESDRMKLIDMGPTEEGKRQYMAVISSPANIKQLDHYKEIERRLARAEGLTDDQARTLARDGKAIIWIDGGLHASETVGSQQLMEWVYQMVSRTDPETMRFLNDCIFINVPANPDGQELVANWYMRGSEKPNAPLKDPQARNMGGLPRLWAKYIGHDDNRDFYMSNMKETTNMNRAMFVEWYPLVVYNHHQTGPAGTVIFMPPFRDPFNYNFDPLIPLGIEQVGSAMHARLVAEGKGGSAMRSGQNYSTWWNGGLRTVSYFHNMIGILTEIIGAPTPMTIPLVADKQLPTGDWPMPIKPQEWHYRQSIEYEMTNNRAIADYASRNRETMLYNFYVMGKRSIEKGSADNWTVTPKRIEALEAAAQPAGGGGGRGGRGGRGAAAAVPTGDVAPAGDVPGGGGFGGRGGLSADLYEKVLHDPAHRDARGYIIPSDQPDFANAVEFLNALLKTGVDIQRATAGFTVAGKAYPAGSYVVKTAQAFRPHVLDMFEPQDHPNDFRYPGGPPNPPYDITGWTLAFQMGVKFDRMVDDFSGPFQKIGYDLLPPPAMTVSGPASPAGYLMSHEINNSFKTINHLLKANADVYWMKNEVTVDGKVMAPGAIWVTASPAVKTVVDQSAKQFGVPAYALAKAPAGDAMKLKPIRIGLIDNYGGSMPSGWTKWLFEQYDFPFQVVYPPALDAGDLHSKFDVLVFPDGTMRLGGGGFGGRGGGGGGGGRGGRGGAVPDEYKDEVGSITAEKTLPQLRKFVESGGSIVTVGSSTSVAEALGLPVKNFLTEMGADGKEHALPRDKFYVPGSLLRMSIDNTNPLAYGMPKQVDVFYDNNPVFRMEPTAQVQKTSPVGWFQGTEVLASGWAWGQQYLDGGTAIAEASLGEGKVVLLGPEVNFRDQPHATFKLLFNGLYYGSAKAAPLQ
jgi:Zinc carboxypeptidase